jgi:hypothetical protein
MAIQTSGDLIAHSLRAAGIIGVGQTAQAEDSNTALDVLRMILAEWQRKRWLVWDERTLSLVSTGADAYTIGPGGDFNAARPDRIESAFCRILGVAQGASSQVDLHLTLIAAREDYNKIAIKNLKTIPSVLFYDSAYPVGVLHFWPVAPAAQYELFVSVKATLPAYVGLTDQLQLPPEYIQALVWSLAVRLQMEYGLPARPDMIAAMRNAMNTLRMANLQVGTMDMPARIGGRGRGDLSSWAGAGLGQAWTLGECALG